MDKPALEFHGIEKSFFGTRVLNDVGFSLPAGHILGLVGENGAGKSTLMNVLGGILRPDSGTMSLHGNPYSPRSPEDATRAGISLVHQELNLFTNLSIAENLFLTDFPERRFAGLRWVAPRELRRKAAEVLKSVRLSLDPRTPVERLSPGERQLVEIARALRGEPRVIVFDEPTTSLTNPEVESLFETILRLRADGVSVIYISHNLGDVLKLCDDVVVLRDGDVQAVGPRESFDTSRLISLMVGRTLETLFPERESQPLPETVLEVRGLSQTGVLEDITFSLHCGEVLGISGLMGSGRTELARVLFGLDTFERGEILIRGRPLEEPSPIRCIREGLAFLTEDRRAEGLLMESTVEDNVSLASLREFARGWPGLIRREPMREQVQSLTQSLAIDCRSLDRQAVRTLSGGNQQKVVLAKWLASNADILILDEPTRGVDVGAKQEIYEQINALVMRGASVLLISSELEELVGLCDRVLVLSRGEIQSVVTRRDFDRNEMLRSALGEERLQ